MGRLQRMAGRLLRQHEALAGFGIRWQQRTNREHLRDKNVWNGGAALPPRLGKRGREPGNLWRKSELIEFKCKRLLVGGEERRSNLRNVVGGVDVDTVITTVSGAAR